MTFSFVNLYKTKDSEIESDRFAQGAFGNIYRARGRPCSSLATLMKLYVHDEMLILFDQSLDRGTSLVHVLIIAAFLPVFGRRRCDSISYW